MRSCLLLASIAMLFALAPRASAEIKFVCHAGASEECAFAVTPADGAYITNFVIGPNQTHSVNDGFAGGKYCEVVSATRPSEGLATDLYQCSHGGTRQGGGEY